LALNRGWNLKWCLTRVQVHDTGQTILLVGVGGLELELGEVITGSTDPKWDFKVGENQGRAVQFILLRLFLC